MPVGITFRRACGGAGRPVRWACSLVPPVRLPLGAASVILASEQVTGRRCHGVHHLWPGPWPGPARARKNSGTLLQPQHREYSCQGPEQYVKRTPRRPRRIGVVESAHCRPRFSAHRSSQVEPADLQLPSLQRDDGRADLRSPEPGKGPATCLTPAWTPPRSVTRTPGPTPGLRRDHRLALSWTGQPSQLMSALA